MNTEFANVYAFCNVRTVAFFIENIKNVLLVLVWISNYK